MRLKSRTDCCRLILQFTSSSGFGTFCQLFWKIFAHDKSSVTLEKKDYVVLRPLNYILLLHNFDAQSSYLRGFESSPITIHIFWGLSKCKILRKRHFLKYYFTLHWIFRKQSLRASEFSPFLMIEASTPTVITPPSQNIALFSSINRSK